ncbi:MAG: response regulator [Desulfofustis sp. PB-SRB1]|jgi:DNA-binding NtrC family response regulator|nr:response regulator [Desulfofustis sp. PB-SRB1]MBM1001362.1 response regulator [Desulfofustis sp. PB-SRB1]HBH28351.1 response regulator [Desulfofustis sp.]HBH31039.1 response regulator [Desulfofustis sp.]
MDEKLNARVLLVDDEEDFLQSLSQRLETRGLKVEAATRGEDAVDMVDQQDFDAIVLDLAMPGMDGLETLKRIREKHPEAEIIMLTGQASIKSSVEAMKLGAEDYLEKPFDINELMEKIGEAKEKHVLVLKQKSKQEIEQILKAKSW